MRRKKEVGVVIFTLTQKKLMERYSKSGLGKYVLSIAQDGSTLVLRVPDDPEFDLTVNHPIEYIERHEFLNK